MLLLLILGNSSAAIFNFVIPRGLNGSSGSGTINGSTPTTLTGFLTGNGSYIVADNSTYLKIDASNDPLTGDLETVANISVAPSATYDVVNSCFTYGGNDYIAGAGEVGFDGALWCDGSAIIPMELPGVDYSRINGVSNVEAGLYNLGPDFAYVTVFYMPGDEATIAGLFDGFVGPGNWSVVHSTGLFVATDGVYAFMGYPSGWTLAATYPTPAVNRTADYSTKLLSDGTGQIGSDLTVGGNTTVGGDLLQVTHGKLLFGASAVPFLSDYMIQAFKAIANPSGNVAGMIFGLQDGSSSPVNAQLWGIDTGLALYGDTNYNWPVYSLQSMARVDVNSHTVSSLALVSAGATMAGGSGGGSDSNISTVGSMAGLDFFVNSQGCDPSSNIMNFYGVHDGTYGASYHLPLGFHIDNWYGIYLQDHTLDASTSWGIYNKDRTYLGNELVINRQVTDHSTPGQTAANTIDLTWNPNGSPATDDYASLHVGTTVNTSSTYIGNAEGLDVDLWASSGSNGINEMKTIRSVPSVNTNYSGEIAHLVGLKVIANVMQPAAATIDNLWYLWVGDNFGGDYNVSNVVGLQVDDLNQHGDIGSGTAYGVRIENQSATNAMGVYVGNSSSYFAGSTIRGDGTIQPANVSDADAQDGSLYYNGSELVFKDYAGAVHSLY